MKKIFAYPVAIASAVILFSACQATDLKVSVAEQDGVKVTIKAAADTRTYIGTSGDNICSFWNKGDVLGVWAGSISGNSAEFTNGSEDGEDASFTGTISGVSVGTPLYAVFPKARIAVDGNKNEVVETADKHVSVNIRGSQALPAGNDSYDPASEILIGNATLEEGFDAGHLVADMCFARYNSLIKMNFIGIPDGIESTDEIKTVIFSVGPDLTNKVPAELTTGDVVIAGNAVISLEDGTFDRWTAVSNKITITPNSGLTFASSPAVYCNVAPCTIPVGTVMVFSIKTAEKYVKKTVTVKNKDISLNSGSLATFNIDLSEETATDLPTVTSTTTVDKVCDENESDGYTATFKGHYVATNVNEDNLISTFFYYTVKREGANILNNKHTTVKSSNTDEADFEDSITGLQKYDVVTYQAVSRYTTNVTGESKSFVVGYSGSADDQTEIDNVSASAKWELEEGKTTYKVTITGKYEANEAACFDGVKVWIYTTENGDVVWQYTQNGEFSRVITGVAKDTQISYVFHAKTRAGVDKTVSKSITAGATMYEADPLYTWTTSATNLTPPIKADGISAESDDAVIYKSDSLANFLFSTSGNNALYLQQYLEGESVYFVFKIDDYTADRMIQLHFDKFFHSQKKGWAAAPDTGMPIGVDCKFVSNQADYSDNTGYTPVGENQTAGAAKTVAKEFEFSFANEGTGYVCLRIQNTWDDMDRFFFGPSIKVYLEATE